MKLYIGKKDFKKESREVQVAIVHAANVLYERIKIYENQGVSFQLIFNDDKVKYDKHGEFFTFKCQKSKVQLRILYTYLIYNQEPIMLIADYFVKKKNNKNYIKKFDYVNKWDPMCVLKSSFNVDYLCYMHEK